MNRNVLTVSSLQRSEIESLRCMKATSSKADLPFIGNDTTVGMEYELQVAVEGNYNQVDLPISIRNSSYYKNIVKRTDRGDLSPECVDRLDGFLYNNRSNIWENSWVRFPQQKLSHQTRELFERDLLEDKSSENGEKLRGDAQRFRCRQKGQNLLRIPVSYLLKLSLAEALTDCDTLDAKVKQTGLSLLDNFTSDNTSPEVLSMTIPRAGNQSIGELAAQETARTFLLCQLLVQYANKKFGLLESGQKSLIYFAPHAPARQKQLNEMVPDGFYRHLFMSPCLSGWNRGEEKHAYMGLCHKTLSRSGLNTISKLRDAGILTNNLITLPNTSNTCLANNGTHVSLGSRLLGRMRENEENGYTAAVEKYNGDLVIKIVEHFLPLFVASYSAAPFRIDFRDFHPENVLGFLPHELDYTHLRMIWRRWKKKADNGFMGKSFTPFGPKLLDSLLGKILGLKGDIVPDFRLVDYLVSLLSTETSPALNGEEGNHDQLKQELMELGVFDTRMSIYLLYRQRLYDVNGYSGFEGRAYSLFHSLLTDMAEAVDMQNLISALAYKYVISEQVSHVDIPDDPSIESERRQIFFGSAIGIPTFYVRENTPNIFLQKILGNTEKIRKSTRYRGYLRVKASEYKKALVRVIREDGAELVAELRCGERLDSLEQRLGQNGSSAHEKIMAGVSTMLGGKKNLLSVSSTTFNLATEEYCRNELKEKHLHEGLEVLFLDCQRHERSDPLLKLMNDKEMKSSALHYLESHREDILQEKAEVDTLKKMIHLCVSIINQQRLTN